MCNHLISQIYYKLALIVVLIESAKFQSNLPRFCYSRYDEGPCRAAIPKWYYKESLKDCLEFEYGGCGGNPNNFETQNECLQVCGLNSPRRFSPYSNLGNEIDQDFDGDEPEQNYSPGRARALQYYSSDVCQQKQVVGNCKALMAKWYYDQVQQQCKPFFYGGCGGNGNRFDTKESCEEKCGGGGGYQPNGGGGSFGRPKRNDGGFGGGQTPGNGACNGEPDVGPCLAQIRKWYFDPESETCKTFFYGGCGGNDNRFDSQNICAEKCGGGYQPKIGGGYGGGQTQGNGGDSGGYQTPGSDACNEQVSSGPCYAQIPKWYYDQRAGACKTFNYGGCGGNDNRFDSQNICVQKCGGGGGYQPKIGGGSFGRPKRNKGSDICGQEMMTGSCRASIPSWYYDQQTQTCKPFLYTGCDGNDNRFPSRNSCTDNCGGGGGVRGGGGYPPEIWGDEGPEIGNFGCNEEPDKGPCSGIIRKWYYDQEARTCKPFIYGGCGGNDNRFDSQNICFEKCGGGGGQQPKGVGGSFGRPNRPLPPNQGTDVCEQDLIVGPCKAQIRRWYYNPRSGSCKAFFYSGCGGSGNNFNSESSCLEKCGKSSPGQFKASNFNSRHDARYYSSNADTSRPLVKSLCYLPPDGGTCKGMIPMFYYNWQTKECQPFYFGGCRGNKNRFETEEECLQVCNEEAITRLNII